MPPVDVLAVVATGASEGRIDVNHHGTCIAFVLVQLQSQTEVPKELFVCLRAISS